MRRRTMDEVRAGIDAGSGKPAADGNGGREGEGGDVERWVEELTAGSPPAERPPREWDAVCDRVVGALMGAESWPGHEDSPRLLLDAIAHRSLAPEAGARRGALARALAERVEKATRLDDFIFLLREIALVGEGAEVPALQRLLADSREPMRAWALYALAANPSAEAGRALVRSLEKAEGPEERIALANAVGTRRDPAAVPALRELARNDHEGVASAALAALGNIGTREAAEALAAASENAPDGLRADAERACLLAAERLAGAGEKAAAAKIWRAIDGRHAAAHHRHAARLGLESIGEGAGQ